MASLQRFVSGQDQQRKSSQTPPPSAQSQAGKIARIGRKAIAPSIKVPPLSARKSMANSTGSNQQQPSTAPAPGYASKPTVFRNTFPNQQFMHQLQQQHPVPTTRGIFEESTVTSGFDETRSDVQVEERDAKRNTGSYNEGQLDEDYDSDENEADYEYMEPEDQYHGHPNDYALQDLEQNQLKQSQSQTTYSEPDHGVPRGSKISGRFHGATSQQRLAQHTDLELRLPQNGTLQGCTRIHGSSKEHGYEDGEDRQIHEHKQVLGHDDQEESQLPGPRSEADGAGAEEEDGHNAFEASSDGAESPSSGGHPSQQRKLRNSQSQADQTANNRFNPDYEDDKLMTMAYADLKKETWEGETYGQKRAVESRSQNAEVTLEDLIVNIANYPGPEDKAVQAQATFFAQMNTEEWEQSGDFFVGKFAELMNRIKEARKKKRDMVTKYENLIEAREKAVRGKSKKLEKDFKDMRTGGEGVLKGKMI